MRRVPCHKQKKGPDGKRLCLVCEKPCPKHRRSYCSDECWIRNTPGIMRDKVYERDKGICALCSMHCDVRRKHYEELYEMVRLAECNWDLRFLVSETIRNFKASDWYKSGDGWQADHIVPVSEGGGLCGLDNYRTLCLGCHKKATAELVARLAEKRNPKPLLVQKDSAVEEPTLF